MRERPGFEVGPRIRAARVALGMSQGDLARAADMRDTTVSRYEQGWLMPSAEALVKLSRALNVTVDSLLVAPIEQPPAAAAVGEPKTGTED